MFLTPLFTIPTSTSADLTGNISAQLGDPGTLTLVVIVASIPFIFYFLKKVIGLIPKR